MAQRDPGSRKIWSCRLCPLPEEDEGESLENCLRSKTLSFWDDADALGRFLRTRALSQAECADLLGRSQSAIANRLRLLRLPQDVRFALRSGGATERHARAILRLRSGEEQRRAAEIVLKRGLNVAETEDFVEALLSPRGAAADLAREQREAVNTLWKHLEETQARCPGLEMEIRRREGCLEILLRLPRK